MFIQKCNQPSKRVMDILAGTENYTPDPKSILRLITVFLYNFIHYTGGIYSMIG